MTDQPLPRGTRRYVAYTGALGRAICERVAAGESVAQVCADPAMPDPGTVVKWARARAEFGREIARARAVSERLSLNGGSTSTYSPAVAQEFYERVCDGEAVIAICRDPTMPSFACFYRWRQRFPAFADMMREAREIQADRFCDLGWEIASQVTPRTAAATRVKLGQLRWTAGMLAPRRYGRARLVEAEAAAAVQAVLLRHFKVEVHPQTGQRRVVGYTPDPDSMTPLRDSVGPWTALPAVEDAADGDRDGDGADETDEAG